MRRNGWAIVCAETLILVGTSACGCPRYKCGSPPSMVVIRDENGTVMRDGTGVHVTGPVPVEPCPPAQACSYTLDGIGDFSVTAPGYKSVALHVAAREDECGNAVGQTFDVNLVPESSSETSVTHLTVGKSCGE